MLLTIILIFILNYISYIYITSLIELNKSNLPSPLLLPLFGHFHKFFGNTEVFTRKLMKITNKFKNIIGVYFGTQFFAFVYNPDDIANLPTIKKKSSHYDFLKLALGNGVLISHGDRFKQSKKVLLEAMASNNLKSYLIHFNVQAKAMVHDLENKIGGGDFNMDNLIGFHIFKTLLGSIVGLSPNLINDKKIVEYLEEISKFTECTFTRCYSVWLYPDFIFKFSSLYREQKKIADSLHALTDLLIEERKRILENPSEMQGNKVFIDTFLNSKKDNGENFTIEEIREDTLTLFTAGLETSSNTLGVLIMLLAIHPDIQQKVYDEVMDKLGDIDDFSIENIQELTYVEQVLNETLRFFSPLPLIARDIRNNYKIPKNRSIRKGSTLVILLFLLHRHPDYYSNPATFNPENFNAENIKKRPPTAFLPFGITGRKCIGETYAKIFLKLMLAHLVKNFIFETSLKMEDFRFAAEITMKNKTGTVVSIHRRENGYNNYDLMKDRRVP